MRNPAYGHHYRTQRASLLGLPCELRLMCEGDPADSADHVPPLSLHVHVNKSDCCVLRPACMRCQGEQARLLSMRSKARRRLERLGHVFDDERTSELVQSVSWL